MTAGRYDLTIEQGATLARTITWTDSNGDAVDLTGYTAEAQGRASYEATVYAWRITSSSGITLGGIAGTIALLMTAATTAALSPHRGVWDLELTAPDGTVTRLLEGAYTVRAEATR